MISHHPFSLAYFFARGFLRAAALGVSFKVKFGVNNLAAFSGGSGSPASIPSGGFGLPALILPICLVPTL